MNNEMITEIMEVVCNICLWPIMCDSEDALQDHCEECPVVKRLEEMK